jgi:PAS domain S-box-containing protein
MPQPAGARDDRLKLICLDNLLASQAERVYFKDRQSRFLFVSAGWIAAYAPGRTAQELAGKTDFDIFTYDHAFAAMRDEQEVMRTGRPMVAKVERETFPGGGEGWVSTTKMPLLDERGQVIGTFGISRDVSTQVAPGAR